MKSKLLLTLLSSVVLVGWGSASYAAPELADNDALKIKVGGMTHGMILGDFVSLDENHSADKDPTYRRDPRAYMMQDRVRLDVKATQGDYKFYLQTSFGPEETTYGSSLPVNSVIDLVDCYAEMPFLGLGRLTVGQFVVPYGGMDLLGDDHYLLFNDRSVQNLGFMLGRDYGAQLDMGLGDLSLTGAIVSLGSRNVPPRYIPEVFGIPGIVARIGYGDLHRETKLVKQTNLSLSDELHYGIYLNAIYSKDTLIGHGSVFNNRTADKNLLFNKNYNPWLGETSPITKKILQAEYWEYGLNGGVSSPMFGGTMALGGELNYSTWSNPNSHTLRLTGGEAQVSYTFNPVAVALRYGVLYPDTNMKYTTTTSTTTYSGTMPSTTTAGTAIPVKATTTSSSTLNTIFASADPITEITPAFTYYLNGENLRLTLDAPIYLNTLTFAETGNGPYVFNQQPDQVTSGNITRQLDYQIRIGLTAQF